MKQRALAEAKKNEEEEMLRQRVQQEMRVEQ